MAKALEFRSELPYNETGKLLRKFVFSEGIEQNSQDLLDQFYVELEDCEVNGNCGSFRPGGRARAPGSIRC